MRFPNLFRPLDIRGRRIRNRLFFPPHGTSLASNGKVSDDLIAYHVARARGGVGMIVLEGMSMHDSFEVPAHYILAGRSDCVPGFRRLAAAVHREGAALLGQLFHPGAAMRTSPDGTRLPALAASTHLLERYSLVSTPAPAEFLEDLAGGYARAAFHMVEGGFDGVEILASMGYLVAQFLNPATNRRQDRYGGSRRNRIRLLADILRSVRAAIGDEPLVGVRIGMGEPTAEAIDEEEIAGICGALEARGLIDYVSVIGGNVTTARGWIEVFPHMAIPPAHVAGHAARLRRRLDIPVLLAGRVNQPQTAERLLEDGCADMIGAARAMIADPFFARKAEAGDIEDIRACIACNQACVGHRLRYFPVSCIQHPETGRERRFTHVKGRAASRLSVIVAGGGPGGMKAAATAGERGHDVTLHESGAELGGQVLAARALPGREEFGGLITNLARELRQAGVRVILGSTVTADLVRKQAPDAVIVATGGLPWRPRIPGDDEGHVVTAGDVVSGRTNVGNAVVVADSRNDWVGPGIAERLARDGCHVRLAVTGAVPGESLTDTVRDHRIGVLHGLGVEIVTFARLAGIGGDTVFLQHTVTDAVIEIESVDTVVTAHPMASDTALARALDGWRGEVRVIGDALSPRTAEEAVFEGLEAAMTLGA